MRRQSPRSHPGSGVAKLSWLEQTIKDPLRQLLCSMSLGALPWLLKVVRNPLAQ